MRILHTSDIHLGISLNEHSFIDYQKKMCRFLTSTVSENNIDAVIISGDIFDNSVSSAEAISIYNETVTELCIRQRKTVFICAGNHDGAARLSSCNELLKSCGLYIYGRILNDFKPVCIGDCCFFILPYFNRDEVKSMFPDEEITSYDSAMRVLINHIEPVKNKINILAAHCFVSGGIISDSDTAAKIGGSSAVSAEIFEKFDYTALGHLHRPQWITPKIRYSGTPMKYSFSEANHTKSVTVFDTKAKTFEEIPIPQPIGMKVIRDTYDNIIEQAENDTDKTDLIKIIMTDRFRSQDSLNGIKEFYPNLLELSGIQTEADGTETMTMKELAEYSLEGLAEKYYKYRTGENITEKQLGWLIEAAGMEGNAEE